MQDLTFAQARIDDYPRLLRLNELAVPNVNRISSETLAALHRQSIYLGIARLASEIAGFLLALPDTADYESPNFQYFRKHYESFAYVDRIVVDRRLRNRGIGESLYLDLHRVLGDTFPLLTCEVNVEPPNPGSMRFHKRLGFSTVATQETEGGIKRVALLKKELSFNRA